MLNWYKGLSIRWKLQLGFFVVTMITTIYNRILATHELNKMIDLARSGNVATQVIDALQTNVGNYIFNSFWESGLEFTFQFFVIGVVANLFVKPIHTLVESLKAVEQGDLTRHVEVDSRDELGVLSHSFNDVLATLNAIMRQVDNSGKRMGQSAFQIAAISREIADVSKREESRSGEVNHATDVVNDSSLTVEERAKAAAARSRQLEEQAQDGIHTVQRNIREMEQTVTDVSRASGEIAELSQSANQIHHIIDTIKEIAGQTNLLALNAAIEAARAGEQGRGFAVVADEVRKLAERTTQSAVEVSNIISHLSGKIEQSTAAMAVVVGRVHDNQTVAGETASSIEQLSGGISETARFNSDIADASRRQIEQMAQLKNTLDQLFATLSESATKVGTTATIGHNLYEITEELNTLMAKFSFDKHDAPPTADNDKRRHPRADNNLRVKVSQGGHPLEAVSKDLSLSGMRLAVSAPLDEKQAVALEIYLPVDNLEHYSSQIPMLLKARVAWQRREGERTLCGIEFSELDSGAIARLKDCFAFYNKHPEYVR